MDDRGVYMKELSREEAIKSHRDMWNYIAEQEAEDREDTFKIRDLLKSDYIKSKDPNHTMYNDCYLCEYAVQQYQKYLENREDHVRFGGHCNYCPLDWKSEQDKYMCEDKISWLESPASVIANLPEKIM